MPVLHAQPDSSARSLRVAIILAHALVTAGFTLAGLTWPAGWSGVPVEELVYYSSVALLLLFGWSLWSWKLLTGSWFDPYSLFLTAAHLFNAGQAFLEVFQLNPAGILPDLFSAETILRTQFLVFLGLAALHLGALLSVRANRIPPTTETVTAGSPTQVDVRRAGWMLLLVSVVPTVLLLQQAVARVLTSGYFALYQVEQAVGLGGAPQILASFLVPAALFLLAGSKGSPGNITASGVIVLANSCCQLFLGFRYYAVMPLVAYLWVWHRAIRPVPRWVLVGGGLVLMGIVFPVVSATRQVRGEERLSVDFLSRAFSSLDAPAVALVSEMGGSMRTVAHTLELVPAQRDYDLGVIYLYGLSTLVPNLFWDVHPSVRYGTSSHWLIWEVDPDTAALGGGLGYSFIAEAYLNFGWLGTPLVTGLLGFLYGRFVLWGLRGGEQAAVRLALVGCFASFFTFYAREDVAVVFRSLIWYSLGPYGLVFLIASWRNYWRAAGVSRLIVPQPQSS